MLLAAQMTRAGYRCGRTWMGRVRHTLQSRVASGPLAASCMRPAASSAAFCMQPNRHTKTIRASQVDPCSPNWPQHQAYKVYDV